MEVPKAKGEDDKKMEETFKKKTHDRKMRSFVTKAERMCKEFKRLDFMIETMLLKSPCPDDGDVDRQRTALEVLITSAESKKFFESLEIVLTTKKTKGTWPYKLAVPRRKKKEEGQEK